ncbi:glycine betaine ABC transporter substrate-binding protein [Ruania albidiflava]|uniref:glycine betaine ABC transporter substrate-binding protein n=1 Tax=Ruania albidiflava TaxID=366586 RepID=UPI00316ADC2A
MRSTTRNMIGVAVTAAFALGLAACGSDEGDGGGDDNAAEGDNIVVTLWHPHWAYDEFPIRDLEDPEGALGEAEEIHTFGRTGFAEDYPQLAEWIGNFTLSDEQLASLENLMLNENDGEQNEESAAQWLEENPDWVEATVGSSEPQDTADDMTELSIGMPAGWDEGVAVSHLWKAMLEDFGYTVNAEDADIGVIFTSLAGDGGYELLFDGWLPTTHADYYEQYGDQIEDLGIWYDEATLNIAVNEDAPIDSLDELADNADAFGNRIVGIDPGAGLTRITEDEVIPTYGLEDMEFVTSSTSAMLAELTSATS